MASVWSDCTWNTPTSVFGLPLGPFLTRSLSIKNIFILERSRIFLDASRQNTACFPNTWLFLAQLTPFKYFFLLKIKHWNYYKLDDKLIFNTWWTQYKLTKRHRRRPSASVWSNGSWNTPTSAFGLRPGPFLHKTHQYQKIIVRARGRRRRPLARILLYIGFFGGKRLPAGRQCLFNPVRGDIFALSLTVFEIIAKN